MEQSDTTNCFDQYNGLVRLINGECTSICKAVLSSQSLPKGMQSETIENIQTDWSKGEQSLFTAVRDTVSQHMVTGCKDSGLDSAGKLQLARQSNIFPKYGIAIVLDQNLQDIPEEGYSELKEKLLANLTFLYAQQQEIFDSNDFLGKIPGTSDKPPTVIAVRKVNGSDLQEMIDGQSPYDYTVPYIFPANKAHGAESWSLIIPVDDRETMEGGYTIGGSAMLAAEIPMYEIGMSCIGMQKIQDRNQWELVRYPFSDLSVSVYSDVGQGVDREGGITSNQAYMAYQNLVLAKLQRKE
ncbi:MAG: hypothetical protein LBF49_00475 [Puniceicoccales bacterium]|nr:hypothetical protein [Puniceicoccales bacterium]